MHGPSFRAAWTRSGDPITWWAQVPSRQPLTISRTEQVTSQIALTLEPRHRKEHIGAARLSLMARLCCSDAVGLDAATLAVPSRAASCGRVP
jgi:hypothetical protein